MKPFTLIVGPSGTGKTFSFRNLDWKVSRFADLERKGLPFLLPKDAPKGCIFSPPSANVGEFITAFDKFLADAEKDPAVTVLVIDSISKLFQILEVKATNDAPTKDGVKDGYAAWRLFAKYTWDYLERFKSAKHYTFCTGHDEVVNTATHEGKTGLQRRCKVSGKVWEGQIEKEFLNVFFSFTKIETGKEPAFYLSTKTDGITSAKCPPYFNFPREIPNDIAEIVKKLSQVNA